MQTEPIKTTLGKGGFFPASASLYSVVCFDHACQNRLSGLNEICREEKKKSENTLTLILIPVWLKSHQFQASNGERTHLWRYIRREQAASSVIPPPPSPDCRETLYKTPSLTLATLRDLVSLNKTVKMDSAPVIKAHTHYQYSNYN